ncbi:MAG TPA: DUF3048 domain-containing protein [Acidimicrobiia bacterium]|nr:DUF3048 domain-containing protein [Acidimicrobiia bacterium]
MFSTITQWVSSHKAISSVIAAVLVVGVGTGIFMAANASADVTTTSTEPSTTTSSSTSMPTTSQSSEGPTTTLPSTISPINGLPVTDPAQLARRLLAVKIDNHPNARPHSGINHADMVFEIKVEGITRFLTLWMQSDSEFLGPVRSGRPTDATLLSALNKPTFAISGAQGWVQNMITSLDINLLTETTPAMFRVGFRSAPHNLYTTTDGLRADADARQYEDEPPSGPIWEFGPMPADAPAAASVAMSFQGTNTLWTWDEATWLRTTDGRESNWRDEDGTEGRIGFPVLIALFSEQYSNNGLPSSHTTGTGQAYVFADGKYIEGTWERATEDEWYTLTDTEGNPIAVPPGQAWVSLVPTGAAFEIE